MARKKHSKAKVPPSIRRMNLDCRRRRRKSQKRRLICNNQANRSFDSDSLIDALGKDLSISVLMRCSILDYRSIASLNRNFRTLIRSGEISRLRRQDGVIEYWTYIHCNFNKDAWRAFDPLNNKWMHLPEIPSDESFIYRSSLAVGTELLVFGDEMVFSPVIYRYNVLTNSWFSGKGMNTPRFSFGYASCGNIAIVAGGCDPTRVNSLTSADLNSVELYNSETKEWTNLPSMNKPRSGCSALFMDGKFYVIGGMGSNSDEEILTCGEEFDPKTNKWTEIPDMNPNKRNVMYLFLDASPSVAAVKNELYGADFSDEVLRKFNKERKYWTTIGDLPKSVFPTRARGVACLACGDYLIVISRASHLDESFVEINAWTPSEGPLHWNLLAVKELGKNIFDCQANVMGC